MNGNNLQLLFSTLQGPSTLKDPPDWDNGFSCYESPRMFGYAAAGGLVIVDFFKTKTKH